MSLYSPQVWYCAACGTRQDSEMPRAMGRTWKVCSRECLREIQWRETLSILGKPYKENPERGEGW